MSTMVHAFRVADGRAVPPSLPIRARAIFVVVCGLAFVALASAGIALAQGAAASPRNANRARPITPAAKSVPTVVALAQEQQTPVAPPALASDAALSSQPKVSFEGGQLTIIAENSTLSEILAAVRARTGADIEIPENAAVERLWAQLGPGPPRRVLAALLSSTDLNYVIQASDSDLQGIPRILLSPRSRSNGLGTSGRQESSVSPGSASPGGGDPTDLQPAQAEVPPSRTTPASAPIKPASRSTGQMIQELRNMYEERKQLQHSRKPPPPN